MAKLTKTQALLLADLHRWCGDDDDTAVGVNCITDEVHADAATACLRRMEKRGLAERSRSGFLGVCWAITDAGRRALAEER